MSIHLLLPDLKGFKAWYMGSRQRYLALDRAERKLPIHYTCACRRLLILQSLACWIYAAGFVCLHTMSVMHANPFHDRFGPWKKTREIMNHVSAWKYM